MRTNGIGNYWVDNKMIAHCTLINTIGIKRIKVISFYDIILHLVFMQKYANRAITYYSCQLNNLLKLLKIFKGLKCFQLYMTGKILCSTHV